jgi:hypothetical protein
MALAAYAIVSLAEARAQFSIGASDTDKDAFLEVLIDQCSAKVEDYCGRKIVVQSVSGEIHDGDGSQKLYTLHFPVTQLSTETAPTDAQKLAALQYRTSPDGSWTDIASDIDHVFIDSRNPFIELWQDSFPIGRRNVKVSYKAGFTGVDLDPIKRIVLEMVQIGYDEGKAGNNHLGIQSSGENGAGTSFSTSYLDLTPKWKSVLDRYRIRRM